MAQCGSGAGDACHRQITYLPPNSTDTLEVDEPNRILHCPISALGNGMAKIASSRPS